MKALYKYKIADNRELTSALKLVHDRYFEAGYIKTPLKNNTFYDEYVKNSIYFVAKKDNQVVGTIRLIKYLDKGLPSINEFDIENKYRKIIKRNTKKVVEVGNLAALPGNEIAKGLYKIAINYSIKEGYKYWVAAVDQGLFVYLIKKYPFIKTIFHIIAEPKDYVGSVSVPIIMRVRYIRLIFPFYEKK